MTNSGHERQWPVAVVVQASGAVIVANPGAGTLMRHDSAGRTARGISGRDARLAAPGRHLQLFARRADSTVVVDLDSRHLYYLDPAGSISGVVAYGEALAHTRVAQPFGLLGDGTVVALTGGMPDPVTPSLVRRLHDVVAISSSGDARILLPGVHGRHEILSEEIPGRVAPSAVIRVRYPTLASHFRILAAAGERIFLLRSNTELEIRDVAGCLLTRVTLPKWPDELDIAPGRSYNANEIVPLGMLADARANLWLERPRSVRSASSEWWVFSPAGELRGQVIVPSQCVLRSVGVSHAACEVGTGADRRIEVLQLGAM